MSNLKSLCECGCNGVVTKDINRFILGHNARGQNNPMYGKTQIPWNKGKVGVQIPWNKGKVGVYSGEALQKMSAYHKGKTLSEEHKRKIGEFHKGKLTSKETKRKMRLSAIAHIERKVGQIQPNYNSEACRLIEEYGKKHGYNFQHAENGGEFHVNPLGYWVDGYDVEHNTVIEVYEPNHRRTVARDNRRQQEIKEHLKCEFIILWI